MKTDRSKEIVQAGCTDGCLCVLILKASVSFVNAECLSVQQFTKMFYHFLSEGFSEFTCPLPQVNLCQQPPPTKAQSMLGLLQPQAYTLGFDSLLLV